MNTIDRSTRAGVTRGKHRSGSPQGIPLLGAVFTELSRHFGTTHSTVSLLRAAQRLIDIAEGKHQETAIRDPPARPDYFSRNVASALQSKPWTIACREQLRMTHCDDLRPETAQRIRQILQDQPD
jgi:hypothetical protein